MDLRYRGPRSESSPADNRETSYVPSLLFQPSAYASSASSSAVAGSMSSPASKPHQQSSSSQSAHSSMR